MKLQVRFFSKDGQLIGIDTVPYPPGTELVQVNYANGPESSPLTWPQYEPRHDHVVEPAPGELVFGADSREILPGEERPLHPLISKCRCGRQITRLTGKSAWEYCD